MKSIAYIAGFICGLIVGAIGIPGYGWECRIVDEAQQLAGAFQVQGIPHSRIIIGDGMTDPITGFVPYGQMKQILDEVLTK